jgi:hypothetical protein
MAQSKYAGPLTQDAWFHVYNHAVGNDVLFKNPADYARFLDSVEKYLLPVAEIYAYCLLSNHFHFLLKVTGPAERFSIQSSHCYNSYSRYFNTKYQRMGTLLVRPFSRLEAYNDDQKRWLTWYIHRNPLHHKLTQRWMYYTYSSYSLYKSGQEGILTKGPLLTLFGGLEQMIAFHDRQAATWNEDMME